MTQSVLRVKKPRAPTSPITQSKYRPVRCDCGRPAVVSVRITILSSTGQHIHERLNLCPACYSLFRRLESQACTCAPPP